MMLDGKDTARHGQRCPDKANETLTNPYKAKLTLIYQESLYTD